MAESQSKAPREISFTVLGQCYSKANSRQLVRTIDNKPRFIKARPARLYVTDFHKQCPKLTHLMEGDLVAEIHLTYNSRRPDLDCSLILDAMEGCIYKNDRQVREQHLYWDGVDKENPRAEITIRERKAPSSMEPEGAKTAARTLLPSAGRKPKISPHR